MSALAVLNRYYRYSLNASIYRVMLLNTTRNKQCTCSPYQAKMAVVNLAEEVLGGVLQAAEQLQGSVVAAETGAVECLRWSGALPLLLRDLSVQNVVSAEVLFACETSAQLRRLLLPPHAWSTKTQGNGEEEVVEHLVVVVTGFLWDYEAPLTRILSLGVIRRLTLCSSLSERAHECYDFEKLTDGVSQVPNGAKATKTMRFDEFAAKLEQNGSFPKKEHHKAPASSKPTPNIVAKEAPEAENEDEEWGWTDETPSLPVKEEETSSQPLESAPSGVQVLHLPLNFAPLLSSKTFTPEPSVFVLCHPICASAFPLLLHQVLEAKTISPISPTNRGGTAGLSSGESVKRYSNVKEVLPEHIPSSFRRSMRLLAHTLAEMLVTSRLEVKERIFAMGGTSLKIGHTLLRILNEIQEDTNIQATQGQQAASVVLIDRYKARWMLPIRDAFSRMWLLT
ncbi:hypothetical protein BBJ28_00000028 [Nothophytophthora sp. Chile5]|nr:hypothetical protein BBJ28_00000028 [Nothophytophthora sp. Chile5]